MASDVLQDLIRALCSLNVVQGPLDKPVENASRSMRQGTSKLSERREGSAREAA